MLQQRITQSLFLLWEWCKSPFLVNRHRKVFQQKTPSNPQYHAILYEREVLMYIHYVPGEPGGTNECDSSCYSVERARNIANYVNIIFLCLQIHTKLKQERVAGIRCLTILYMQLRSSCMQKKILHDLLIKVSIY